MEDRDRNDSKSLLLPIPSMVAVSGRVAKEMHALAPPGRRQPSAAACIIGFVGVTGRGWQGCGSGSERLASGRAGVAERLLGN